MQSKLFIPKSLYQWLILMLLLAAVALRGGASYDQIVIPTQEKSYTINEIKQAFNEAESFQQQEDKSLIIYDKENNILGYALLSEDFKARFQGYAGKVPVLIALGTDKIVKEVILLKNQETPGFIEHVKAKHLLESWNNQNIDTTLIALKVDAVSGATYSSKAIIFTVQKTMAAYLELSQKKGFPIMSVIRFALLLLVGFLSLNMIFKKRFKKLYWFYLAFILGVFGLWLRQMLSIELFYNWLTRGVPLQSNKEMIAVLLLALVMAMLGQKKYYCNYLCPMGALQVIVSKISPFKKITLNLKYKGVSLRIVYLTFIWTSLILGFTLPLSAMEPFLAFSFAVASWVMLLAGLAIVILSLFINRPWCQLCPTGCLLESIPSLKQKEKQPLE